MLLKAWAFLPWREVDIEWMSSRTVSLCCKISLSFTILGKLGVEFIYDRKDVPFTSLYTYYCPTIDTHLLHRLWAVKHNFWPSAASTAIGWPLTLVTVPCALRVNVSIELFQLPPERVIMVTSRLIICWILSSFMSLTRRIHQILNTLCT